ncbi:MAG: hypothetical protein KDB88_00785 [Flavobacteriales bacterium]|nr:hypothetical protein [Flavobacteriales bacterium]
MTPVLDFFHSLLRYGVLLFVLAGGVLALKGLVLRSPILIYERQVAIIAVVLCHVQLALGLILYATRFEAFQFMSGEHQRFWKYEHIGSMIIAITLVTLGRVLAKRAKLESRKQLLVAVFYLLGFVLMMAAIPWPFRSVGHDLGWL